MSRRPYVTPTVVPIEFPVAGQSALWLRTSSGGYNWQKFVPCTVLKVGKRVRIAVQLRAGGTRDVTVLRSKIYPPHWAKPLETTHVRDR